MINRKFRVPAISLFRVYELTVIPKEQHNINMRKFAKIVGCEYGDIGLLHIEVTVWSTEVLWRADSGKKASPKNFPHNNVKAGDGRAEQECKGLLFRPQQNYAWIFSRR